ncbi:MAG: phosphoglycerate kinase [Rickettsiales bacterium]|jgi:phosphoglycerate kinase|nr:phosphoglycerate kinase [Rickettsiales bacterium]
MFRGIENCKVKGKVVFLRVDLNVPTKGTEILDDTRIRVAMPTIEYLVSHGAKAVVASHFGSPKGEGFNGDFSIKIVLEKLQSYIPKIRIHYSRECIGSEPKRIIRDARFGEIILLENLRFYKGEESNDEKFAKELASLADMYVNDAFSTSHREHASMVGVPKFLDSYAGISLKKEVGTLMGLISGHKSKESLMFIVGGSKISTKLGLLKSLVSKSGYLVPGGGIANTFLMAKGINIGKSVREENLLNESLEIMEEAEKNNCKVILPVDVVTTKEIKDEQTVKVKNLQSILEDDIIVDLGPETVKLIKNSLKLCSTVVWTGPIGVYEIIPFNRGTDAVAKTISELTLDDNIRSVAGGGDILAALNKTGVYSDFTHVTTAGGAFLKWLENMDLPAVRNLEIVRK